MKKAVIAVAAVAAAALLFVTAIFFSGAAFFLSGSGAVLARGGPDYQTGSTRCIAPIFAGGYASPLVGQLTSGYGPRPNPFGPGVVPAGFPDESALTFHAGQDIAGVPERTPFYSASAGTVRVVDSGGNAGGNGIIIDAGNNTEFWYWHAADGTSKVKAGQTVKAGDELAGVGSTGASTAPHLHFEIHVNGQHVDPNTYMKERGITLGAGGATAGDAPAQAAPVLGGGLTVKGPNGLPLTFSGDQMNLVSIIVKEGKNAGVPTNGILIALMVALQESGINTYANSGVPESLKYPHMKVGSDHDSVNAFQQRPAASWGSVEELMDPTYAARAFYGGKEGPNHGSPRGLLDIPGWEQMSLTEAAQTVQVSAFPDAYAKWQTTAQQLLESAGGAIPTQCTPGADQPITAADNAGTRTKIIEAAKQGVGGDYVWGGTTFKAWDCSGYVQWIYDQAGIKLPRVNQWTAGSKTTDPQPGDLVVQRQSSPGHWEHVGIYAGNGQMYSALNPQEGTLLHATTWETDTEYFTLLKATP